MCRFSFLKNKMEIGMAVKKGKDGRTS